MESTTAKTGKTKAVQLGHVWNNQNSKMSPECYWDLDFFGVSMFEFLHLV